MNHKIRTLILALATGILAVSCQREGGYPEMYYFGSRVSITFSEVTSTNTPGLRELADMLTQKGNEIQKDFQFDWMVSSSGNTREAGSVKFTVQLYLTAEDAIARVYEIPLAVSGTYTFECRGKNESY
ncbi:MAG TPA: hypothetical protein PLM86_02560 [Bacteroidales bacterium]|nr:MAG: hypothetical protein BWX93_01565 [Bacteroidetes bacterium ADurb.Bin139]HOG25053.1 hypothetical protein [Bacteroidales bacterium]HOR12117.1 hypothetical protein [Bacteroidales bacterium]HOZ19171.1 hypothetical protein [Bacteroidales bacterium]HPB77818.1 hypothetical protein [Bacteroidales bacterium]